MTGREPARPRGVLRPSAAAHAFTLERVGPSPALAPWIEHVWCVRWDLRGRPDQFPETLPHPSVHLTIEPRRAVLTGVVTGRFTRRLTGRGRVVGVKFRPAMFQPFLRGGAGRRPATGRGRESSHPAPLSALTDRTVPPAAVLGEGARALARRVRAEPDLHRCAALLEAFLLERLPRRSPAAERVRDLVERMAIDRELVRVEQVAALAGVELRRLQRLFQTYAGVSPKWVLQRYRLHEAAAALAAGAPKGLGALALQLGYFDQAHFIRDFRAVVGVSPGEYLRQDSPSESSAPQSRPLGAENRPDNADLSAGEPTSRRAPTSQSRCPGEGRAPHS